MKAAFFDIDGTLTSAHTWAGLMAYFSAHQRKQGTHRLYLSTHYPLYMARKLHLISEHFFRQRWSEDLAWYFRGEETSLGKDLGDWVAKIWMKDAWQEDIVARLKEHLAQGHLVALISAAPEPLVQGIGRFLGTPHGVGTRLALQDGRYTGKIIPPGCLGRNKLILLRQYLSQQGLAWQPEESAVYADSITDLDLLESVAYPRVVHPDEALRALALARGWDILP